MKKKDAFPRKYLKAADIGQPVQYLIGAVAPEKMPDGQEKPVVRFAGQDQGLVLNQVNWDTIEDAYGEDSDLWLNRPVELRSTTTDFGGKQVPCIRVRIPVAPSQPQQVAAPPQQPAANNQPQQYQQPAVPQPTTTAPPADGVPFDV